MKKTLVLAMVVASAMSQAAVITYTGSVVSIPDNNPGGAVASQLVSGTGLTFSSITSIGILVRHTWQGDLTVELRKVGGPSLLLTDRPGAPQSTFGFSNDNFGDPTTGDYMDFMDSAAGTYDTGQPNSPLNSPTGAYKAEGGSVNAFSGITLDGTWELFAKDSAGGDTGGIVGWYIEGNAVPEPGTIAALGLGAAVLLRRKAKKA